MCELTKLFHVFIKFFHIIISVFHMILEILHVFFKYISCHCWHVLHILERFHVFYKLCYIIIIIMFNIILELSHVTPKNFYLTYTKKRFKPCSIQQYKLYSTKVSKISKRKQWVISKNKFNFVKFN